MKTSLLKSAWALSLALILTLSLIGASFAAPGELDSTFGGDGKVNTLFPLAGVVPTEIQGYDFTVAAHQQADGKMVVVGVSKSASFGYASFGLARYNADGSLDTTFDTDGKVAQNFGNDNGDVTPADAALLSDNRIVVVGKARKPDSGDTLYDNRLIALFAANGSLDTSFSADGYDLPSPIESADSEYTAVVVQADDKIVAAKYASATAGDFTLVRYKTDGTLDNTFDTDGVASASCGSYLMCVVKSLAIQTVGGASKIVAVGAGMSFDGVDFILMRFNLDGSLDTTFGTSGMTTTDFNSSSDDANAVSIQADGKILVAGETNTGGANDFAVARYTADGVLDTTFSGDGKLTQAFAGEDVAEAVAQQADGSILVFGCSDNGEDESGPACSPESYSGDMTLARYTSSGALDTTFDTDGVVTYDQSAGTDLILQSGGGIVGVGYGIGAGARFLLLGLNNDGSFNNSFGVEFGDSDAEINALALQSDGKIVAAGYSVIDLDTYENSFSLARYNTDGSLDTSFDGDGRVVTTFGDTNSAVRAVAARNDGKIVAAGDCWGESYSFQRIAIVRYNANGSLDTSFGTGGLVCVSSGKTYASIYGMALQADGKIVLAGWTANAGDPNSFLLTRYNANGTLDTTFGASGVTLTAFSTHDAEINGIVLQSDGKILAAGTEQYNNDFIIARYTVTGALDTTFGGGDGFTITDFGVDGSATGITLQPDGKAVVAGNMSPDSFALARYNTDGTLDPSFDGDGMLVTDFNAESFDILYAALAQPDGKILAAGSAFSTSTNDEDFALVKYNADGSLDTSFSDDGKLAINFSASEREAAHALALQADGSILLGGVATYETPIQRMEFALARIQNDLDVIAPTVQSITLAGLNSKDGAGVDFTVTFDKDVQDVDKADFTLTKTGSIAGASISKVAAVSASVYTVTVNTGIGNGSIRLDLPETASIQDLFGNAFVGSYTSGPTYDPIKGPAPTVPVLSTPTNNSLVTSYTPILDWNASSQVMALTTGWHYEIQVTAPFGVYNQTFNTADYADPTLGLGESQYAILSENSLPANTTFTWRVRAFDGSYRYSAWSATRTFRTKLATPTLTSPMDDPTTSTPLDNRRPTFTWEPVPGATSYTLQILKENSKTHLFNVVANTGTIKSPAHTYTPAVDLSANTPYTWQVKANGVNAGQYSTPFTFITGADTPAVPILTAPANNILVGGSAVPTLKWSLVDNKTTPAASFEVEYANNAAFTSSIPTIVPVATKTLDIEPLSAGTYYWHVRSWSGADAKGTHSAWSGVRVIKVSGTTPVETAPTVPALTFPTNNALIIGYTPTLDWKSSTQVMALAGSWHYEIQVTAPFGAYDEIFSTTDSPDPVIGLGESQYAILSENSLPANTTFTWKVRSTYNDGVTTRSSAWSATRTFRTRLTTPTLLSPVDDPTTSTPLDNRRPTFTWEPVPGATSYTLQILKENPKTHLFTVVANTGTIKAPTYTYTPAVDLSASTPHTWQVKANGVNVGQYSTPFTFITGVNPPKPPVLSAPASNILIDGAEAQTLSWKPVPAVNTKNPVTTYPPAASFEVAYSTNSGFADISPTDTVAHVTVHDTFISDVTFLPGRTYYWRVRSWSETDAAGNHSAWSAVRIIRVKFVAPTLTTPTDGEPGVSVNPTFTWSSNNGLWTTYTLQIARDAEFKEGLKNFTIKAPLTTFTLPAKSALIPGDYFWRVKINGAYTPILSATSETFTVAE